MQAERDDEGDLMASLSFRKADDDDEEGVISVLDGESPQQISAAPREPADEIGDGEGGGSDEDDDFEFAFVLREPETGPRITPEDIFSDGRLILPVYPVFGRRLVDDAAPGGGGAAKGDEGKTKKALVQPLRHLFFEEERGANPAGSASEDDDEVELSDLSGVPPESYCLWTPGSSPSASPARCKKSNSTGSLLRWRIKDLVMGRSHSDGKEKFVFLAAEKREPEYRDEKKKKKADPALKEKHGSSDDRRRRASHDSKTPGAVVEKDKRKQTKGGRGGSKVAEMDMVTAHRMFYGKATRPANGGARRSFLPYKQELFGLFSGVNGLSRSYHPI